MLLAPATTGTKSIRRESRRRYDRAERRRNREALCCSRGRIVDSSYVDPHRHGISGLHTKSVSDRPLLSCKLRHFLVTPSYSLRRQEGLQNFGRSGDSHSDFFRLANVLRLAVLLVRHQLNGKTEGRRTRFFHYDF